MSIILKSGSSGNLADVTAGLALKVDSSAVTQPVSISGSVPITASSLPLPANAAQETGGNLAVLAGAVSASKVQANITNASIAVTGTFFQATQPVSGTVSVSNFPATQPVSGSVSVSNFPATQPVSIAATVPTTLLGGASGLVADAQAKGVQGVNAVVTQDFKDSGRTAIVLSTLQAGVVSVAAEALLSFNVFKGAVQTTAQTSYTVSAGKTLRINFLRFKARFTTPSTTVTFANVQFNIRNAAAIATTNLYFTVQIDCAANVPTPDVTIPIPDGWELPAGSVIAFSQLGSATTLTLSFEMKGYEY